MGSSVSGGLLHLVPVPREVSWGNEYDMSYKVRTGRNIPHQKVRGKLRLILSQWKKIQITCKTFRSGEFTARLL